MKKEISRVRKSVYNTITMIINTLILSLLSLVSTKLIINNYGSDFNGVVATANQIVNLLLIVEGGFTLAINVALFKPYVDNDYSTINSIIAAAKKTFVKIALIFLSIGTLVSFVYPMFIKSSLDYTSIFLIFLMVIIGTFYNLLFVVTSKIMFQVSQKEYAYTFIGSIVNLLSGITTILLVYNMQNMLLVRLSVMLYGMINGLLVYLLYKRIFPKIDSSVKPDYSKIKGTKDVIIQKITSVIYSSTPILFISTFISTMMSSVYMVYSSIYNIIKSFLYSIVSAPVNGFGQLLSEKKYDQVYKKFISYEYIVILASTMLLSTTIGLIIPFIRIYTKGISDINYVNIYIALMVAVTVFLEIIHIPAGNMINVSGNFKKSRDIQSITAVILIVLMIIGGYFFGIYGILCATIITNAILSFMELSFVHKKIFNASIKQSFIRLLVNVVIAIGLYIGFNSLLPAFSTYTMFFVYGFISVIIVSITVLLLNFLFFNSDFENILAIVFKRRKK